MFPQLLERMRKAVDEQLWKTGGIAQAIYGRAKGAWARKQENQPKAGDAMWLTTGQSAGLSHHPKEDDWREI